MTFTHRCAISSTDLVLLPWHPRLVSGGPANRLLADVAQAGVTLLDLMVDDDELVVTPRQPQGCPGPVARRLVRWAHLVGFVRVWLPTTVVELDPAAAPIGEVDVECTVCRLVIRDWTQGFWEMVRGAHAFPTRCRVCGSPLRQPEAVRPRDADEHDPAQLSFVIEEPSEAA